MGDPEVLLRDQVRSLVATETAIAQALDAQSELMSHRARLHTELVEVRGRSVEQRQRLEEYLGEAGAASTVPASLASTLLSEATASRQLERVLSADYAAFAFAASDYALLTQLSLRLFDPSLRELAPRGLNSYVKAMQRMSELLPGIVVEGLDEAGSECRCVCPMCSLGACGCTAAGQMFIRGAWKQPAADGDPVSGLVLSRPRTGSQLADNDVRAGDRLIEVDGRGIESFLDVQKGIRAHAIGDEVTLSIARGPDAPREVRVKHVGEY